MAYSNLSKFTKIKHKAVITHNEIIPSIANTLTCFIIGHTALKRFKDIDYNNGRHIYYL